jgi:hypothetical protein
MTSGYDVGINQKLERYEMKYLIPFELVEPISRFVSTYCRLDKHSAQAADRFYPVRSLYLDTPTLLFVRQRLSRCDNRYSLRVRTYGDRGEPPWFFEVKHKQGSVVRKYRSRMDGTRLPGGLSAIEHPGFAHGAVSLTDPHRALFESLRLNYNAVPQLLLQYRRKAYLSECDDYARVTFDVGLRTIPQEQWSMADAGLWQYYDGSNDPAADRVVVLELKCYCTQVPFWMIDLVHHFELHRRRFSKYVNAQQCLRGNVGFADSDCIGSLDVRSAFFK